MFVLGPSPHVSHHDLGHEQSGEGGQGQTHARGPGQPRCSVAQVGDAALALHGVKGVVGLHWEAKAVGLVAVILRCTALHLDLDKANCTERSKAQDNGALTPFHHIFVQL